MRKPRRCNSSAAPLTPSRHAPVSTRRAITAMRKRCTDKPLLVRFITALGFSQHQNPLKSLTNFHSSSAAARRAVVTDALRIRSFANIAAPDHAHLSVARGAPDNPWIATAETLAPAVLSASLQPSHHQDEAAVSPAPNFLAPQHIYRQITVAARAEAKDTATAIAAV